jgi:predicted nuclease of predicted toxin-antitoxin system
MKLLFDQNLSFKLCQRLADFFPDSDYFITSTQDESNSKAFKTASLSNSGGFRILIASRLGGISSMMVN